jgi:hypothetical protein
MTASPATRWGLLVFALGILMLLGVFGLSYSLFSTAAGRLAAAETAPVSSLSPISSFLANNAIKLAFLIVMGYVSSLIAGKGLSLYGVSRGEPKE